jgi:hypothetical protein
MAPRRALLITYHFPPSTAAGAQRWDVFTRVAAERGWQFDVLTEAQPGESISPAVQVHRVADADHWVNRASSVLVQLKNRRRTAPRESGVAAPPAQSRTATIEPQVLRRVDMRFPTTLMDLRRNLRAVLAYTSALPWMHAAAEAARRLVAANRYDVIIASGPPHVSAESARVAAEAAGVPLVLDFRDPWSLIDVIQEECASWTYFALAARLERRVVRACRLLVMNTPRAEQAMREVYPGTDIIAVPNGFNGERPQSRHPAERFIAAYAGTIYLDRDPRPLLAAIARITPELALGADNFVLRFYGKDLAYGGRSPEQLAAEAGLPAGMVESHAPLARRALFRELETAALLVNLPQGERQCVPSKVYEYLHFPAWVLGLEPAGTATHDVLASVGADIAQPGDVSAIADLLRTRITAFRAGVRPSPLAQPDQFFAPGEARRFFEAVEQRALAGERS